MSTQPTIYEINTPIFLREVSGRIGHLVTLADVPDAEWDLIARPGIDTVWFMGVWKRSAVAREMAKAEDWLQRALPDMKGEDLLGSAYSIAEYVVDESLGGNDGLAAAREALRKRGIKIILDYVPNHVAIDHHWTTEHPGYFLSGTEHELEKHPNAFVQTPGGIFAKGKDPNFEPWSDVLQLNAFSPSLRAEVTQTLQTISQMCDGVRCDMAMLMVNTIFKQTWGDRVGEIPSDEYWPPIIAALREQYPDFIFLAEVYWDKQQILLDQGFDLCYDKDLYDYLIEGSVPVIGKYLRRVSSYQNHLLRFLENHDEERAAEVFSFDKHKAAAVITMTLPGAHMYHDGEYEGRKVRVPVHLGRRVEESKDPAISEFYDKLLSFINDTAIGEGEWKLIPVRSGMFHRPSRHVLAWSWGNEQDQLVIFVNYSPEQANVMFDFDKKKVIAAYDIERGNVDYTEQIMYSKLTLHPWQHFVFKVRK